MELEPNTIAQKELEEKSLQVMGEMFGSSTVEEAKGISDEFTKLISQQIAGWEGIDTQIAIGAGIGLVVGYAIGRVVYSTFMRLSRDEFNSINPDPARGCGLRIVVGSSVVSATVGGVVAYYIAKGGF
jgi:hypothetical protein